MKPVVFWFDVISPFAYLAFEHMPKALDGCGCEVQYRPVLFAGLLGHWGQKGPAEIEPKRVWTLRHVAWLAHRHGIPMRTPTPHPFNPLALLRLALASADAGDMPGRCVVELLMHHVWRSGADPNDERALRALTALVAPKRDPRGDEIKRELRALTDEAIGRGIFGVPTFDFDGRLFWGFDALPMLRDALAGDAWFDAPEWDAAGRAHPGVMR